MKTLQGGRVSDVKEKKEETKQMSLKTWRGKDNNSMRRATLRNREKGEKGLVCYSEAERKEKG